VKKIARVKIHPAIGIARVGNSPTEFFIGPELPGAAAAPRSGFKDAAGRVRRQAARFRLFGYDAQGKPVREITADEAYITWRVHVANKKAAWRHFEGLKADAPWRNAEVADRASLQIDAAPLTGGRFLGSAVELGEMRTDDEGRLLVLGGFGTSRSPANRPLAHFANNDGWHDDVSDGPVDAVVTFRRTSAVMHAAGAWVICAPPDFAPGIGNVITLYDTLLQTAVNRLGLKLPGKPSFRRDIYPILHRAIAMRWVSRMITEEHAHKTLAAVIPPPGAAVARTAIFARLRNPHAAPGTTTENDMPMLWSDYYPQEGNQPLTEVQYLAMHRWAQGKFIDDWDGPPKPETTITPAGLDRAALEACAGGPCYPGLEASWLLRDHYTFVEPFRLDRAGLAAGDITKQMAVPWQADFTDCTQEGELAWWPAQRPDDVYTEPGGKQLPWTRGLVHDKADMVRKWHRLGFVVKKGARFVERERA